MIKMIRVDERLIHGQVAVIWSRFLKIDQIVVINNKLANDSMQKSLLKMAVPMDVKINFFTTDDSKKLLDKYSKDKSRTLIIVSNIDDCYDLVSKTDGSYLVNIGNYGRDNPEGKSRLSSDVYISEKDNDTLTKMLNLGLKIIIQSIPSDKEIRFEI